VVIGALEFRFGALPLVDVRQQNVPTDDAPVRVPQGKPGVLKPAIAAVPPPEPLRDVVRTAGGDRLREDPDHIRQIVRVNGVARAPFLQLLERPSRVLEDPAIDELNVAIGGEDRHEAGDAVRRQSRVALTLEECVMQRSALAGHARVNIVDASTQVVQKRADSARRRAVGPQYWRFQCAG
jgi:hypothetical protein